MPGWLAPLLTWSYWFETYPAPFSGVYFWIIVSSAAGSFILGLAFSLFSDKFNDPSMRRVFKKLGSLGMTFGALTGISFFFTQTSTPTLGSRFWFALWIILALVWLGFIIKYAVIVAPKERMERARQLINKKYFNS